MIHRKFNSPKLAMTALVLLGLSFVTAIPTSVQAQGATTEDFEAGYTLGQDVGTHADWYDGGDGPHVTAGDGVAGSVGRAPAPNIFTRTAHPFDWNDPGCRSEPPDGFPVQ